jgi:hypothetical protein
VSVRVEFCGVPGSGKSTLCEGVVRELRRRGVAVLDRAGMAEAQLRKRDHGVIANTIAAVVPGWREAFLGLAHSMDDWIGFVAAHPQYAALAQEWIAAADKPEAWRRAVFHAVATTAFEYGLAAGTEVPVWLDEGFAQRFFSLRGYGVAARDGDAERYAQAMPVPSALVWVATAPETCRARVEKRPQAPILLQPEPAETWPARFREGSALLEGLAGALEKRGVPVLRIAGEGGAESAAGRIADFAEGLP